MPTTGTGLVYLIEPEVDLHLSHTERNAIRTINRRIVEIANKTYERVLRDPMGFANAQTTKQLDHVLKVPSRAAGPFGKHLENEVHKDFMADPLLREHLRRAPTLSQVRGIPDWGHAENDQVYWDLTTPSGVEMHSIRPGYGSLLRMVVYERSSTFADYVISALAYSGRYMTEAQKDDLRTSNSVWILEQQELVGAQRDGSWQRMRYYVQLADLQKRLRIRQHAADWHNRGAQLIQDEIALHTGQRSKDADVNSGERRRTRSLSVVGTAVDAELESGVTLTLPREPFVVEDLQLLLADLWRQNQRRQTADARQIAEDIVQMSATSPTALRRLVRSGTAVTVVDQLRQTGVQFLDELDAIASDVTSPACHTARASQLILEDALNLRPVSRAHGLAHDFGIEEAG